MRVRQPCVYILASQVRGTTYIGVKVELPARLYQHRNNLTESQNPAWNDLAPALGIAEALSPSGESDPEMSSG